MKIFAWLFEYKLGQFLRNFQDKNWRLCNPYLQITLQSLFLYLLSLYYQQVMIPDSGMSNLEFCPVSFLIDLQPKPNFVLIFLILFCLCLSFSPSSLSIFLSMITAFHMLDEKF